MKTEQKSMRREKLTKEQAEKLQPTEIITCEGQRIVAKNVIFFATNIETIDGEPAEEGAGITLMNGGWGLRELAGARAKIEELFMTAGGGIIEQAVEELGPIGAMMMLMELQSEAKMENIAKALHDMDLDKMMKEFKESLKK